MILEPNPYIFYTEIKWFSNWNASPLPPPPWALWFMMAGIRKLVVLTMYQKENTI